MKKQLNHLRESEIVSRVIKEWKVMPLEQKDNYTQAGYGSGVLLNVEPLSTPMKDSFNKTNQKTTGDKKMDKSEGSEINLEDIQVK